MAVCEEYRMLTEELRGALHPRTAAVRRRHKSAADKAEERREVARRRNKKVAQAFARLSAHVKICPLCSS